MLITYSPSRIKCPGDSDIESLSWGPELDIMKIFRLRSSHRVVFILDAMPALHSHHQAAKNQFLHIHRQDPPPVNSCFTKRCSIILFRVKLVVWGYVFQFHDCTFFNFLITREIKVTQALYTFCKDSFTWYFFFSLSNLFYFTKLYTRIRGHISKPNVNRLTNSSLSLEYLNSMFEIIFPVNSLLPASVLSLMKVY